MFEPTAIRNPSSGPRVGRRRERPARLAILSPADRGHFERSKMVWLAETIVGGAHASGDDVEVVIATVGSSLGPPEKPLCDLPPAIAARQYQWRVLDPGESRRALAYAGCPEPRTGTHIVPDDGIRQFLDCDLWVVTAPRLSSALLPVRSTLLVLEDWLHHAVGNTSSEAVRSLADTVSAASGVCVFSEWMRREVVGFHGVDEERVVMLPPLFSPETERVRTETEVQPSFTWFLDRDALADVTLACTCLERYYRVFDGRLGCRVVPVASGAGTDGGRDDLGAIERLADGHGVPRGRVTIAPADAGGDLESEISRAAFVWHPSPVDDGRLIAPRARVRGVRCLASDTPPMRELDAALGLGLLWMQDTDPARMAEALAGAERQFLAAARTNPVCPRRFSANVDAAALWSSMKGHL